MDVEKPDRDNSTAELSTEPDKQTEGQDSEEMNEKEALLAKLEEKEAEARANYELFLRERAELENFKRRTQREQGESLRFANEPLIRDLLPVIDNLERAVGHAQSAGNGQPLVEGVALVVRSLLDTLEKHGVTRVAAKGALFDPTRHEAMAQVENAAVVPNTVVDEYRPAYLLHGRLLRPALVSVAKAPAGEEKSEE